MHKFCAFFSFNDLIFFVLCHLFSGLFFYILDLFYSIFFVELIHLNDLLNDVTFPPLTNQMPRKCGMTYRQRTKGYHDIMMTYALQTAAVKRKNVAKLDWSRIQKIER